MEEAYVFDMGGVIKESFDLEKFFLNIKAKIEFKQFKRYYEKNILLAECGKISSDEFLERILNYSLSEKTIEDAKMIYGECTGKLYDNVMNIIYEIKKQGKKVYLLSNLKQIDFDNLKQKLDINIFEKVFLSYKLGCMKNGTKIFQIVIDELKINPKNIYFFDDKEENINNAKKLGLNAHLANGMNMQEIWYKLKK